MDFDDNIMAYYTCLDTSDHINTKTGMKMPPQAAWEHIKSINDNEEGAIPPFSYNFDENQIRVRPKFMESVSILWRPFSNWDGQEKRDENEADFKEDVENLIIILNKKFKALKVKKNFEL